MCDSRRQDNAVLQGIARIFRETLTCHTEELLGRVCLAVAEEVTQSKFGFIGEINPQTGKLDGIAVSDPGWDLCRIQCPPASGKGAPIAFAIEGIYGRVLRDSKSLFTNDPSSHPDSVGTPAGHPLLTAFLGVPLIHAGKTMGMVGLANREGGYSPEQVEAAEALAPAIVQAFISKRAETAVRESREDLNRAQAVAHTGSWRLDVRRNELLWSDETWRMFGLARGTPLTYETFLGTVHPDDREYVDRTWTAALRGDPYDIEHRIVVDGQVKWVRERAELEFDEQGELLGGFGTTQDITERKQAEDQVRSMARFPEENPNPVLRVSGDGTVLYANPPARAALDTMGWTEGLPIPEPLVDPVRRCLRLGAPTETELTCPRGRVWSFALSPTSGESYVTLYARDITARAQVEEAIRRTHEELEARVGERTAELLRLNAELDAEIRERERAEEALKLERQRFHDVLEMLPVYVVLLTPDYHVPFANRFFRERFGESHGKRCFEYLFHRTEPCEICDTYTVLKTGKPHEWEWTGPDGRNYEIFDFPFTDTDGSTLILEMGIDVTERKQAVAALRQLNEELEERVASRTSELAAANRELEAFAYSVSHDLRAPLRAIDGFSQALLEDYAHQLDEEGRGYLQRARAASQRMAELIDGLLTLSRTGRSGMRRTAVDLSALARAVAQDLQKSATARRVEWVVAGGLVANGDADLLRAVLENLLGNAWKFTSKHPAARIEVGATQHEGQTVYFVQDDGAGFDMAYADKLFLAFQRLHTAAEFGGTGIGLATVQRIIHRHGGRIWAEAELEKGATFYFTLPPISMA